MTKRSLERRIIDCYEVALDIYFVRNEFSVKEVESSKANWKKRKWQPVYFPVFCAEHPDFVLGELITILATRSSLSWSCFPILFKRLKIEKKVTRSNQLADSSCRLLVDTISSLSFTLACWNLSLSFDWTRCAFISFATLTWVVELPQPTSNRTINFSFLYLRHNSICKIMKR